MTTRTIDCIDCGVSVPYGRLSCPACGALLASVAGALRPAVHVIETAGSPEPELLAAIEPASEAVPVAASDPEPVADAEAAPLEATEPTTASASDPDPETTTAAASEPEPEPQPVAAAEPEPEALPVAEPDPEPAHASEPVPEPVLVAEHDTVGEREPVAAAVETPPAKVEPETARWLPLDDAEPRLEPRPYVGRAAIPAGVAASPAAYRPPAFALATATGTAAGSAWPTVGRRTALGGPAMSGAADPVAAATAADPAATSPATRSIEVAGWLVTAGAAASILGFVLPWSRVVIGSAHTGGYFDTWGLASPSHLIVLAGLLVVLGLAIVPTGVPVWIRTGVLGLASGGILVGLAWPYVVGPLGAEVGVTLALAGGVALGIGGILASWATRHASEEPSV